MFRIKRAALSGHVDSRTQLFMPEQHQLYILYLFVAVADPPSRFPWHQLDLASIAESSGNSRAGWNPAAGLLVGFRQGSSKDVRV